VKTPFVVKADETETGRAACLNLNQERFSGHSTGMWRSCQAGYPPSPDGKLGSQ